jgi:hypothetical protein
MERQEKPEDSNPQGPMVSRFDNLPGGRIGVFDERDR